MLYLENDEVVLFLTFAKKPIRLSHNWEKPKTRARFFTVEKLRHNRLRRQMGQQLNVGKPCGTLTAHIINVRVDP
jgi:hypothetical protein